MNEVASFIGISSGSWSSIKIKEHLPKKLVELVGESENSLHKDGPLSIVTIATGVDSTQRVELHIEKLISLGSEFRETLEIVKAHCALSAHLQTAVTSYYGWSLSNDLLQRMQKIPVEWVFGVTPYPRKVLRL